VALAIRLAYMTLAHTYRIRPYDDHFQFGWEMGRIGRALATGYGFADPFVGHTGPTAWVTPLYPLLIGGIFKILGVYTLKSAWVLLAINCVFSALMVRTTWEIGARCFGPGVARWSAWIWALYPAAMQYAVRWVWEMTITAFLFSWIIVIALRMRNIGGERDASQMTTRRWAIFGVLWGLVALSNPSLLIFLPFCGFWILFGAKNLLREVPKAAFSAILCLLVGAPWVYRNELVFHRFVPLRGNFGAELYLGNGPGANGLLMEYNHPEQDPVQLRLYRQMGEIAYSKSRGMLAAGYIRQNPGRFVSLCLKRMYYFWASVPHPSVDSPWTEFGRNLNYAFASVAGLLGLGLALRRRVPASGLMAMAFLTVPLAYYVVAAHARFRHPLEPLLVILGVFLFQSAKRRGSAAVAGAH
jgi:Dolichyl-phosphate-mannose-protein mannosyltransferase